MTTTDRGSGPGTPGGWALAAILPPAAALALAAAFHVPPAADAASLRRGAPARPAAVLLPERVVASMNDRFLENNRHWDEAPRMNRLTQLLRSGGPTQLEYMGCLRGSTAGDTVRVWGWEEARGLIQLQFGVDGSCDHVPDLVGTWHTHPYRAGPDGRPVKTRRLSPSDLESFEEGGDRVIVVLWDVDSLTAAVRDGDGRVIHPAAAVVR